MQPKNKSFKRRKYDRVDGPGYLHKVDELNMIANMLTRSGNVYKPWPMV